MQQTFIARVTAIATFTVVLTITACSGADSPAAEPDLALQAQSVPTAAATSTATPLPLATATPGALRTEIIEEPISPISSVAPPGEAASGDAQQDNMEPPANLPPGSETAVQAAITDLAQQQTIDPATITVVSVEPTEWSDASLGCPQEGFMYAQVITPGFLVILQAQGTTFEYHTDQNDHVVWCQP